MCVSPSTQSFPQLLNVTTCKMNEKHRAMWIPCKKWVRMAKLVYNSIFLLITTSFVFKECDQFLQQTTQNMALHSRYQSHPNCKMIWQTVLEKKKAFPIFAFSNVNSWKCAFHLEHFTSLMFKGYLLANKVADGTTPANMAGQILTHWTKIKSLPT